MRDLSGGTWHAIWIVQEGWEALMSIIQWCHLLTDTQRLLVPTAVVLVTLVWSKHSPRPTRLPEARDGDELYAESLKRWMTTGTPAE
jgi:hypothetical protein